ncbi:hypothetical protein B0J12DRAFT_647645 [Macrophomina phaseolina]|uniref:Uncharacterized protein n=1 Tax=Macrophomina phaseolina TaxID=35725 RepID=A0ABQ8GNP0_9PEZI|nr:hypothetical protein B0J12DRAFT_647645 [Macrophomina phaseolina]
MRLVLLVDAGGGLLVCCTMWLIARLSGCCNCFGHIMPYSVGRLGSVTFYYVWRLRSRSAASQWTVTGAGKGNLDAVRAALGQGRAVGW